MQHYSLPGEKRSPLMNIPATTAVGTESSHSFIYIADILFYCIGYLLNYFNCIMYYI